MEFQTLSALVTAVGRLQEELSRTRWDKDRSSAKIKIVLAIGTEIWELETTTVSFVGSLREEKARAVKSQVDREKAQEAIEVLES